MLLLPVLRKKVAIYGIVSLTIMNINYSVSIGSCTYFFQKRRKTT